MRRRSLLRGFVGVVVAAAVLVPSAVATTHAGVARATVGHLTRLGTTVFTPTPVGSTAGVSRVLEGGPNVERDIPRGGAAAPVRGALSVPTAPGSSIAGSNPGLSGWDGLNHFDQRSANGGNQFSLEPPDQGLCVGGNFVVEAVNTVVKVYTKAGGTAKGVEDLNTFFGLPAQATRDPSTGAITRYGPFVSDPKCYYDVATGRWFLSLLEIDLHPHTGAFGSSARSLIAVSKTSDPTGSWTLYSLDTTDASGAGCPCFGDQPLIGADRNGFYISTNEFSITGPSFNGAQIYAISKAELVAGVAGPTYVHFGGMPLAEGVSYSVQPATSPGTAYASAANGTEYLMSALQFNGTLDNRVAVWALTNTQSLTSSAPNLHLSNTILTSETYGFPPNAAQKPGNIPLGSSLNQRENKLATNDDRMNQVVYAAGHLYSGVNTIIQFGGTRCGIAYFIATPSIDNGSVKARIARQGYVAVRGQNVFYPSIGVNSDGQGVMAFTLSGPNYYPSAAYVDVSANAASGDVHIAELGNGAADGFTGYKQYGGTHVERWGDYSAAVADTTGNIWLANEDINTHVPRTTLANWNTFIYRVAH